MATYPRVTPPTLTNYEAVINDPQDSEDANKLGQVDLQTRRFVSDFLQEKFDKAASDALKPGAVTDTSLAGKVKGSTANSGGTQQAVVQGTISTPDIRDAAVNSNKLADNAVTTTKIADDQVNQFKIANNAVITAKIADANVTTAKMAADSVDAVVLKDDATGAAGAVNTDHIRTSAVTKLKIADNVVDGDKIRLSNSIADILVADANKKFQPVALSGDATISSAGVLTLTQNGVSVVEEKAANGVHGGGCTAVTWNDRGVTVAWVIKFQTVASMVNLALGAGKISFAAAGTYIVEAKATAHQAGKNVVRINRFNAADVSQETFNGITQNCPAAGANTSMSSVIARVTIAAGDYIKIQHWSELTRANDGLGLAVGSGSGDEIHCSVEIRKSA